ncbi:MAG TPA: SdrD B-like domain-containing protein, partial [Iamia sp.]|nr:SdrD B-like domain-containing protein [Iamia sp.]
TLTLTNDGPSTATDVLVDDGLPDGLRWVGDSGGGAYDPDTGRWFVGTLAAGRSTTLQIATEIVGTGPITNEASVLDAAEPDHDSSPGNDDATEDDQDAVTITALTAAVQGAIWLDADGNGTNDAGEVPIPDVTVLLFAAATGDVAGSDLTDAEGRYAFRDVAPGRYVVVIDEGTLPDTVAGRSFDPDPEMDGTHPVDLAPGDATADVDFGYEPGAGVASTDPPDETDDLGFSPGDLLARTGLSTGTPVVTGLILLLAGALVVTLVRRRRPRST